MIKLNDFSGEVTNTSAKQEVLAVIQVMTHLEHDAGDDAPGARCNFDFGTCKPNGPGNPTICEACGYEAVDGTPLPCCPGMLTSTDLLFLKLNRNISLKCPPPTLTFDPNINLKTHWLMLWGSNWIDCSVLI